MEHLNQRTSMDIHRNQAVIPRHPDATALIIFEKAVESKVENHSPSHDASRTNGASPCFYMPIGLDVTLSVPRPHFRSHDIS